MHSQSLVVVPSRAWPGSIEESVSASREEHSHGLTLRALAVEVTRLRTGPVDFVFFLVKDFLSVRRDGDMSWTLLVSTRGRRAGDSLTGWVIANENSPEGVAGVVEPDKEAIFPPVSVRWNLVGNAAGLVCGMDAALAAIALSNASRGTCARRAICFPGEASASEVLTYLEI